MLPLCFPEPPGALWCGSRAGLFCVSVTIAMLYFNAGEESGGFAYGQVEAVLWGCAMGLRGPTVRDQQFCGVSTGIGQESYPCSVMRPV